MEGAGKQVNLPDDHYRAVADTWPGRRAKMRRARYRAERGAGESVPLSVSCRAERTETGQ